TSAIPYAIEDAWRTALTAPQGPVWLEIPEDVLLAETSLPHPGITEVQLHQPQPRTGSVESAARLLSEAARPVIVAGGGVRRPGEGGGGGLQGRAALIRGP